MSAWRSQWACVKYFRAKVPRGHLEHINWIFRWVRHERGEKKWYLSGCINYLVIIAVWLELFILLAVRHRSISGAHPVVWPVNIKIFFWRGDRSNIMRFSVFHKLLLLLITTGLTKNDNDVMITMWSSEKKIIINNNRIISMRLFIIYSHLPMFGLTREIIYPVNSEE